MRRDEDNNVYFCAYIIQKLLHSKIQANVDNYFDLVVAKSIAKNI